MVLAALRDDAGLVLSLLEMWVREQEKHFGQLRERYQSKKRGVSQLRLQLSHPDHASFPYLVLLEKVGQELHGVHAQNRDIIIRSRVVLTKSQDLLVDVFLDLDTNLHTYNVSSTNFG